MKRHIFALSLLFVYCTQAQTISIGSTRPLVLSERAQLKQYLDAVQKDMQDECYLNITHFKNDDLIKQVQNKQKAYIDLKTKNVYVVSRLAAILPLGASENVLPESTITFTNPTHFQVTYLRPVMFSEVNSDYSSLVPNVVVNASVEFSFELFNGQIRWQYGISHSTDRGVSLPHVRCQPITTDSVFTLNRKANGSHPVLDLELAPHEMCKRKCSDDLLKPVVTQ